MCQYICIVKIVIHGSDSYSRPANLLGQLSYSSIIYYIKCFLVNFKQLLCTEKEMNQYFSFPSL